ncbi:MAG TPA: hypothetical protein VFA79_02840 [Myxococcales bacterium]|nr:hypothetical protein [Myxococcales bacterium]
MMGRTGLLVVAFALVACARTVAPPRQSEAMERSARILRQLDRLEADLHQGNAETVTYAELVDRHARAEQIACKVTDDHVNEIHRLAMAQEEKMLGKRLARLKKRKAVAMARRPSARHAVASN